VVMVVVVAMAALGRTAALPNIVWLMRCVASQARPLRGRLLPDETGPCVKR
jgi:hypothetical protein